MEKLKDFLSSPKKTAILGLIGSVLNLAYLLLIYIKLHSSSFNIIVYLLLYANIIGLITYFSIILLRILKKKGNIKIANYTLLVTYIVSLVVSIFVGILEGEIFNLQDLLRIITILYLFNILFHKLKFMNNKIFAVLVIIFSLLPMINALLSNRTTISINVVSLTNNLGYLLIIPYFYNFYNLLKEENKNGK